MRATPSSILGRLKETYRPAAAGTDVIVGIDHVVDGSACSAPVAYSPIEVRHFPFHASTHLVEARLEIARIARGNIKPGNERGGWRDVNGYGLSTEHQGPKSCAARAAKRIEHYIPFPRVVIDVRLYRIVRFLAQMIAMHPKDVGVLCGLDGPAKGRDSIVIIALVVPFCHVIG
jgi:hypothetical protein